MKKSSRDYRKNRRQKWVKIHRQRAMVSLAIMNGAVQLNLIASNPHLLAPQRAILMAEQAIHTANLIAEQLSHCKNLVTAPAQDLLSELQRRSQA